MPKKIILYISTNDGSDMRINKEIRTLSKSFQVIFMGVGSNVDKTFIKEFCHQTYLISGKRNHPVTIAKQILLFLKLIFTQRIHSIHIINEQLMVFFWPFLFFKHTVLDIFDSIFLKLKVQPNQLLLFKRLVYLPINKIIVTDENRKNLMPTFTKNRLTILPNFPYQYKKAIEKVTSSDAPLVLLFFGWLGMNRGGKTIKDILASDNQVKVIMAGWFSDEETKQLQQHPNIDYRGVLTQQEALTIAANETDYILCVYAPNNLNHINASPNKIYDAIQTHTPVIINKEVKVAQFVEDLHIGIVLDQYEYHNYPILLQQLKNKRGSFSFSKALAEKYTWENIEEGLIDLHVK